MISALPLLVVASLVQTAKKSEVRLVDLTPVTQIAQSTVFQLSREFSIGGIVLAEGIQLLPQGDGPERTGRLVYSVPKGSEFFKGKFGIADSDAGHTGESKLQIVLDGETAQELSASTGDKPTDFEVTVKDSKSIMLVFKGTSAIADAVFTPETETAKPTPKQPQPAEPVETPKQAPGDLVRMNLTAPQNGEVAKNDVTFKWDPVDGAISYGVEIVMITNANPKKIPSRFMRAFSASGESFEWNFSDDVLSGEYQVSVIAFGKNGVLSKFSNSRRFKVTRK